MTTATASPVSPKRPKRTGAPRSEQNPRGSKFSKKAKARPAIRTHRGEPVFHYLCECHDKPATKPPCVKSGEEGKPSLSTLGSWRCSVSNKPTKVRRTRRVPDTEVVADAGNA